MTPRPEDVALLNEVADSLVAQYHGYVDRFKGSKLHAASLLRALASRLEGEGRDGERLDWLFRANAQEVGCDAEGRTRYVVAFDTGFAGSWRAAIDAAMQSPALQSAAPASCNQPTTTTEEGPC